MLAEIYYGHDHEVGRPGDQALINPTLTLPALAIVPVHRSDSSGDTFLFTSYLSTQDPGAGTPRSATAPRVDLAAGRRGAAPRRAASTCCTACAATPGCVAYNGISYLAQAQATGWARRRLQNSAGNYTLPTRGGDHRLG